MTLTEESAMAAAATVLVTGIDSPATIDSSIALPPRSLCLAHF
jgi:hypothetical protein